VRAVHGVGVVHGVRAVREVWAVQGEEQGLWGVPDKKEEAVRRFPVPLLILFDLNSPTS